MVDWPDKRRSLWAINGSTADLDWLRSPQVVGGKAARLAWLHDHGYPVPSLAVVPPAAFLDHCRTASVASSLANLALSVSEMNGLRSSGAGDGGQPPAGAHTVVEAHVQRDAERLRDAIAAAPLNAALRGELDATVSKWSRPVAVRSSMIGEDGAEHSFAGQLSSVSWCRTIDEIAEAIRTCWASAFSDRVLAYRASLGLTVVDTRVAVVVQQMIEPVAAGVAFSADPVTGDTSVARIAAVWGHGETLVSGDENADEFSWSAAAGVRERSIADKTVQLLAGEGPGGAVRDVEPDRSNQPVLTDEQIGSLGRSVSDIAKRLGTPADIEWVFDGDEIWIVQARPMTGLRPPAGADPANATDGRSGLRAVRDAGDSRPVLWDNANIQESYCGVTTPLTFSFASAGYATVYRTFYRLVGLKPDQIRELDPAFRSLLGLVGGRVFYNLQYWYLGAQMLPALSHSKEDMEAMMGVDEPVSFVEDDDASVRARLARVPSVARAAAKLLPMLNKADAIIAEFRAHFDSIEQAFDRSAVAQMSLEDLVGTLDWLDRELLENWEAPILNDVRVMRATGNLRRSVQSAAPGADPDQIVAGLLAAIDNIASLEPTREVARIAADIADDPVALAALGSERPGDAVAASSPYLAARIGEWINRYGDRVIGELKLETVTVRQDPTFLWELLRQYVDQKVDPVEMSERERSHFEQTLNLVADPLSDRKRTRLTKRLDAARQAVAMRERLRLDRTRMFGMYRDVFLAMGARLAERGALAAERDVFYLTVDELRAYVEGRAVTADLSGLVALRKAEFDEYQRVSVPNRFTTDGTPYGSPWISAAAPVDVDAALLKGLGCYPGVVEGPVRIVTDASQTRDVGGAILVAVRTDPGWAPLFPTCRGLLVERGSTLSHSAIVAREMGIPAIVAIPGLTEVLKDGDIVRMDGAAGTIERLDV